jgi:hypothetical protein
MGGRTGVWLGVINHFGAPVANSHSLSANYPAKTLPFASPAA